DFDNHVTGMQMGIIEHVVGILTRSARYSGFGQDSHHLVFWSLRGPLFNQRIDLRHVLGASARRIIARVTDQILTVNSAQERRPHLLLRQDKDIIVQAARVAAVCRGRYHRTKLVAVALDYLAEALVVTQTHPHEIQYRLLHGDLDPLAFTSRMTLH